MYTWAFVKSSAKDSESINYSIIFKKIKKKKIQHIKKIQGHCLKTVTVNETKNIIAYRIGCWWKWKKRIWKTREC